MIELRWLMRPFKIKSAEKIGEFPAGDIIYEGYEKVLQYRTKYIYTATGMFGNYAQESQWSDWIDVPEVIEDDTTN